MPNDEIIYFDTPESAELFAGADVKRHFWTICRYFVSEKFMTYCGVATGVTLLNSLGVEAPDEPQIYPYKMFTQDNIFTDEVLHIRRPRDVERNGNTLAQLAEILRLLNVEVGIHPGNELDTERLRTLAVETLKSPDCRLAVNFDRSTLDQKGSGHFSPVAAYHSSADRFLVMDVARYKLPPFWVTTRDLCESLNTLDDVSQTSRGMLVLTRRDDAMQ